MAVCEAFADPRDHRAERDRRLVVVEEDLDDGGEIGLHFVRGHRALVAHPCEVPRDVDVRDVEGGGMALSSQNWKKLAMFDP